MKLTPNTITLVTPSMQSITLIFMGAFKGEKGGIGDGLQFPLPFVDDADLHVNPTTHELEWQLPSGLIRYRSAPIVDGVITIDCSQDFSKIGRLLATSGENPYVLEHISDVQIINPPSDGFVAEFTLELHQDPDIGGWTYTYPSNVKHAGGSPVWPTTPGATVHIGYVVYSDGQVRGYPTPVFEP